MRARSNVAIIREIYDYENSEETFERELDRALEIGYELIIIEPSRLGEETAHWIKFGNCLHRCAIIFGISSICLSISWSHNTNILLIPLSIGSVFCAGLYMVSWQFDPCCKYQIAHTSDLVNITSISNNKTYRSVGDLILASSICTTPTILIRKSDHVRKILHSTIASIALFLAIIKFCK